MLRKTTSHEFKSLRTGCRYKIRQNITCESKDIVYLVTCNKHNIQGVGCTKDLKSRINKHMNHHKKENRSCGITEHFLEDGLALIIHFNVVLYDYKIQNCSEKG